ncbi:MAG: SEL1-like repeat protein [Clostridia bacterium]|nr:SEL1-like repeat protein [Clostridia bacterium]
MQYTNPDRELFGYLCVEEEASACAAKELLQAHIAFCQDRSEADVLVCDHIPQDYNAAADLPLLCIDAGKTGNAGYVLTESRRKSLDAYFAASMPTKSVQRKLFSNLTFVAVYDAASAEKLVGILQDDRTVSCVGVLDAAYASICSAFVVFLDQTTLQDTALCAYCADSKLPVIAILADGVTKQQAQSVCGHVQAACPAYDIWQIRQTIQSVLGAENLCVDGYGAGIMHLYGVGRKKDIKQGIQLLTRSAQMGNVRALLQLSLCAKYAIGMERSSRKAELFLSKAAHCLLENRHICDLKELTDLDVLCAELCDRLISRGQMQQARMAAVQAHRLCEDYLASSNESEAKISGANCALLAAQRELEVGDMEAYARYYIRYARLQYQAKIEESFGGAVTRQFCDGILGVLDQLVQYLPQDTAYDMALDCSNVGVLWQQYVFDTWQDIEACAALVGYLQLRGTLLMEHDSAQAAEDFKKGAELCSQYAAQDVNATRQFAVCKLDYARALQQGEQFAQACEAHEQAQALWQQLYDAAGDAAGAGAICRAAQGRASSAVKAMRQDASEICTQSVQICSDFANVFRSVEIWEALANCYGAQAEQDLPCDMRAAYYKQQADMWHQLHLLTYEASYRDLEKKARKSAKAMEKEASPNVWKRLTAKRSKKQEPATQDDLLQEHRLSQEKAEQDETVVVQEEENLQENMEEN